MSGEAVKLHTEPLAWFGMAVPLPTGWNMTAHRGDPTRGMLAFADMRAVRFELRWQQPKDCGKQIKAMLKKLTRAGAVAKPIRGGHRIEASGKPLVLASGARRVFELYWLDPADFQPAAAEELVQAVIAHDADERWHWSVYGASGDVNRKAKLAVVRLMPGAVRLEFRRRRQRTILGSWSMAERLLRNTTLRAWASRTIPLVKNHPTGQWRETPDSATFSAVSRRLFGRVHHLLTLVHDAAANQIRWIERSGPPGSREDAC